jgi:hypothetical protein
MPIDNLEDRGIEMNGSKSKEYCKYCYQNGAFTDPSMTLEQMQALVSTKLTEMQVPDAILQNSMQMLPSLRRWKKQHA